MDITHDEVTHLLAQPEVTKMLASFNRIRAANHRNDDGRAVELLNRSREFEALTRRNNSGRLNRTVF